MKPITIEIVKLGERFAEKYEATCDGPDFPELTSFPKSCGTVFRYTVFDIDPQSKGPGHAPCLCCPACGRIVYHREENRVA